MTGQDELCGSPAPDPMLVARQLAALREWLARPVLTVRQAACLLVGFLPPQTENDHRAYAGYLPPRKKWELGEESARKFYGDRVDEMETFLNEAPPPKLKTPRNFIKLGIKLDIVPEWLEYACKDDATRKYLPLEALFHSPSNAPLSGSEVASLGGQARRDKDPKRKRFYEFVRTRVEQGLSPAGIIRQLHREYGDEPDKNLPADGTVYRWVKEIERAIAEVPEAD
jgi:hypothetical protein